MDLKYGKELANNKKVIIEARRDKIIKDIDNSPNGWMKEALEYLLTETMNQSDIDWNKRPIIKEELKYPTHLKDKKARKNFA